MKVFNEGLRKQDADIRRTEEELNSINKRLKEYALKHDSLDKDACEIKKSKGELEKRVIS